MEDEQDFTSSDEYEALAIDVLEKGGSDTVASAIANVYATLALCASVREAAFIFAEALDPADDEDEPEEEVE